MLLCLYWELRTEYWLTPAVHRFPPQHFRPLVESDFRPFAVGPPGFAELRRIAGRGHAELVLRQAMAKNHQGAAGMIFGGHDQHAMCAQRLQASAYVVGLGVGRETDDRAYRNAVCFAQARSRISARSRSVADRKSDLASEHSETRAAPLPDAAVPERVPDERWSPQPAPRWHRIFPVRPPPESAPPGSRAQPGSRNNNEET